MGGTPKLRGASRGEKIRVLLVDDHPSVLNGIRSYFRDQGNVEVVGQATDGAGALRKVRGLKPDVVLLDLSLPDMDGLEVVRRMRLGSSKPRFLVYTMHEGREYIRESVRAGANGFVLKSSPLAELLRATEKVLRGSLYIDRSLRGLMELDWCKCGREEAKSQGLTPMRHPSEGHALTEREKTILRLMADGFVLKEIADQLGISYYTVTAHAKHIYVKLQVHTVGAAIGKSLREGLL